jgi:dienelactone hydrolase
VHIKLFVSLLAGLCLLAPAVGAQKASDPVFNFDKIYNDPLDVKLIDSTEEKGCVVEKLEYTAEVYQGKPVRIFAVLAYPKGGKKLPAVYWSQGGMYEAGTYWPLTWAAKGYMCINVTLPHDIYNSFVRFTTETPEDGNMAHLALAQMRGITLLAQRPEADANRIGVGGSSYGGFFATLIAGADPRVKAGMSFFTSGEHKLGTNYPQFTQLRTTDEVGIWSGTIDPAWRLKRKAVPFLWGVASDDHWMHLPAAIKTYQDSIGEKRLAIAPNWYHAFPANVDQELIDWFDVYLAKTRKPYNKPSALEVKNVDGRLTASWSWTGDNQVKNAELLVAYGRTRPWHDGWLFRYHYAIPAKIKGNTATAIIPVPEKGSEMLVYGNITDDHTVLTSTEPITVNPDKFEISAVDKLNLNTALVADFSPTEMEFVGRHGEPSPGAIDKEVKQAGEQSLHASGAISMKLGHIPGHSHKLALWLRAEKPTALKVTVSASTPACWQMRIVDILRRQQPDSPNIAFENIKPPVYTTNATADTSWKEVMLDCPLDDNPVEGYTLSVAPTGAETSYWLDTISFTPQWK